MCDTNLVRKHLQIKNKFLTSDKFQRGYGRFIPENMRYSSLRSVTFYFIISKKRVVRTKICFPRNHILFCIIEIIHSEFKQIEPIFMHIFLAPAHFVIYSFIMMTSSNGNFFRVTGPLCGEFTGHR